MLQATLVSNPEVERQAAVISSEGQQEDGKELSLDDEDHLDAAVSITASGETMIPDNAGHPHEISSLEVGSVNVQECQVYGDPHIVTFDMQGGKRKDFFGWGDYWIVKNDIFEIQGRYSSHYTRGKAWITELAISSPSDGGTIIIKPPHYSPDGDGISLNGITNMGEFRAGWVTHEVLESKNKLGTIQEQCEGHMFTIESVLVGDIEIAVDRCQKSLNVIITMPWIEGTSGQCGNFDGNADNDQPIPTTMIDESDVKFKPIDWDDQDVWVGEEDCSPAEKATALDQCQQKWEHLHKKFDEGDEHDDYKQSDIEVCVVDYCASDADMAFAGLKTEFHRREREKQRSIAKCPFGWVKNGVDKATITGGTEVPNIKSSKKCGKSCIKRSECKSFTFAIIEKKTSCRLHETLETTGTDDSNQVLCKPVEIPEVEANEVTFPPRRTSEETEDHQTSVSSGCSWTEVGKRKMLKDCTNKDMFEFKLGEDDPFVEPTYEANEYGNDAAWRTFNAEDPTEGWSGACVAYAKTKHKTCSWWCDKVQNGMQCVRGMDDAHHQTDDLTTWLGEYGYTAQGPLGGCTLLPSGHSTRGQSTAHNGCDQTWDTQICACEWPDA